MTSEARTEQSERGELYSREASMEEPRCGFGAHNSKQSGFKPRSEIEAVAWGGGDTRQDTSIYIALEGWRRKSKSKQGRQGVDRQ